MSVKNSFLQDNSYLALCSEKTLQSETKGFFMTFVKNVEDTVGHVWIEEVFGKLKTDDERIRTIFEDKKIKYMVCDVLANVQEIYRQKNVDLALEKRVVAEKEHSRRNYTKSLMLYGQSILRAPTTKNTMDITKTLAVSLWQRAQLLISMDLYTLALADIKLALAEGLPAKYKGEAFWKMGVCHKVRGEEQKAKVSFELAEKLLVDKDTLRKDMEKEWIKEDGYNKCPKVLPKVTGETHKDFPNATKKITIKEEVGKGRYVVANEKISTGDVVVVESPYAACLLPECFGSHCHHCFERLIAPVGCDMCSNVAFCKTECKKIALSTYHRFECKFLDLLIGSGMSVLSHTALRMVTQFPVKKVLEMYADRKKEHIYSLCTNAALRKPSDFLQRSLMAAFLLRILQKSGYFRTMNNNTSVVPTEEEYKVGELLLFNLQMLQFNAHEVYETRYTSAHRFKGAKIAHIGVAVYPTVALFNHDCYPAVTRYFSGNNIVINAVRPLEPGAVIAENYGPIFTKKSLVERQKNLFARYWFECSCTACKQDWPSIKNGLNSVSRRIRCPTLKCNYLFTLPLNNECTKCPRCKKNVELTDRILQMKTCEEQYQLAMKAMETDENPEITIRLLCQAIDIFHEVSCPPHRDTHLGQEMLRACLADNGNVYQCVTFKE